MSRAPVFPVEEKVRIVLSILAGEVSVAEAARRAKASEQSVGNWKVSVRPLAPNDRFHGAPCVMVAVRSPLVSVPAVSVTDTSP